MDSEQNFEVQSKAVYKDMASTPKNAKSPVRQVGSTDNINVSPVHYEEQGAQILAQDLKFKPSNLHITRDMDDSFHHGMEQAGVGNTSTFVQQMRENQSSPVSVGWQNRQNEGYPHQSYEVLFYCVCDTVHFLFWFSLFCCKQHFTCPNIFQVCHN